MIINYLNNKKKNYNTNLALLTEHKNIRNFFHNT